MLRQEFGVDVKVKAMKATAITYGGLADLLQLSGTELLVIDAEGHDCQILESMIEYCQQNSHAWPDIICFETLGHSDRIDGPTAEESMVHSLVQDCGYCLVVSGHDTTVIRIDALATELRLQHWLNLAMCERCGAKGEAGMPFMSTASAGTLCCSCSSMFQAFSHSVYVSDWEDVQCGVPLSSLAADGSSLWAVSKAGTVHCHWCCQWWELKGARHMTHVSVSYAGTNEVWGVNSLGQVMRFHYSDRRWTLERRVPGPRLKQVLVSCDGSVLWGIDDHAKLIACNLAYWDRHAIPGWLAQVSISRGGADVWGVNAKGEVWCRSGIDSFWKKVDAPEPLRQVVVSGDGHHVWGVDRENRMFHRAEWTTWTCDWHRVFGRVAHVCVGYNGMLVWALTQDGHLWRYNGT